MNGTRVSSKIGIEEDYCNEISFVTKKGRPLNLVQFYGSQTFYY